MIEYIEENKITYGMLECILVEIERKSSKKKLKLF